MSLQLRGILNSVEVADEGWYFDGNKKVYVPRSGRRCKGLVCNCIIATVAGGLTVTNAVKYGCLAWVEPDNENPDSIPLLSLINYGGLVASKIAQYSNGVLIGFNIEFGLYRDDEQYKGLSNINNSFVCYLKSEIDNRPVDGIDRDVHLTHPGSFYLKVPFLGNNADVLIKDGLVVNYNDSIRCNESFSGEVHYVMGYLKYIDGALCGVYSNDVYNSKVISNSNIISVSNRNNDSALGFEVKGSTLFGDSDYVISEKFSL